MKSIKPSQLAVAIFLALGSGLLSTDSHASAELDRKYALETIGFLRAWDNLDGLMAEYVEGAYKDYFIEQTRFVLHDLSRADSLLIQSKIPFGKVIEDKQILGQLARATRTQSLIRTRITREGSQYRFVLSWLHSPGMDALANEEFIWSEKEESKGFKTDEIRSGLQGALDRIFRKLPFSGMVTGRDQSSVTLNLGSRAGIQKGDTVLVGTIDEVKKHPLLTEIVSWRITPTGKLVVEQVEEGLAFCRVIEEEPDRKIARFQKVTRILPLNGEDPMALENSKTERKPDMGEERKDPPRLGWMSGAAWIGSFSRQYSTLTSESGSGVAKSGGGLVLGSTVDAQFWLTSEWFGELRFGYGFWSYSQDDIPSGTETASGLPSTVTTFKIAGGRTFLLSDDFYGPKGWLKLGLHSTLYTLPILTTEYLTPASFSSPFLGFGAELPIRGGWNLQMSLEYGLFSSGKEMGSPSGDSVSASDVQIFLGAHYQWKHRINIRAGVEILANGAEFSNSASLSQKIVTFAPSLMYYF